MKINLVLSKSNWTSFHQVAFTNILQEYFDIVFVEDCVPNKDNSLLVSNLSHTNWYQDLHNQGFPLVMDLLWGESRPELPNSLRLTTPNWFWYHEALLYFRKGYDQYIPNRLYLKKALMPMGLQKQSHDLLFDSVISYLDDFIYSYIERLGKYLPNDAPTNFYGTTMQNQRYFNPEWYDQTYYSLVSETKIDGSDLHITEKTFKPIAFYHPFLLWGQHGILKHLKNLGFESFENLFDESYDIEPDNIKRLNIILANIQNFKYLPYDDLTVQKTKHNHQLFFNFELIKSRVKKEIVDPITEFFEKTRHS